MQYRCLSGEPPHLLHRMSLNQVILFSVPFYCIYDPVENRNPHHHVVSRDLPLLSWSCLCFRPGQVLLRAIRHHRPLPVFTRRFDFFMLLSHSGMKSWGMNLEAPPHMPRLGEQIPDSPESVTFVRPRCLDDPSRYGFDIVEINMQKPGQMNYDLVQ